jgi:hypothetical protein
MFPPIGLKLCRKSQQKRNWRAQKTTILIAASEAHLTSSARHLQPIVDIPERIPIILVDCAIYQSKPCPAPSGWLRCFFSTAPPWRCAK